MQERPGFLPGLLFLCPWPVIMALNPAETGNCINFAIVLKKGSK